MTLAISDAAFNLIVTEEVGSADYYTRHYQHWDWPEGASGPTIGVGYDCGYVTTMEARADWDGLIDDLTMEKIVRACGIKGRAAAAFVNANRNGVTITWTQAQTEFRNREIPKWVKRISADLPNIDRLSPDSLGALVSLAYNRGCSFDLPGPRFAEMRAIKQCMATEKFVNIPGEILAMRRLWPTGGDLYNRRMHEANLFMKGLPT